MAYFLTDLLLVPRRKLRDRRVARKSLSLQCLFAPPTIFVLSPISFTRERLAAAFPTVEFDRILLLTIVPAVLVHIELFSEFLSTVSTSMA